MKTLIQYVFNDLEKDYNVDYTNPHGACLCAVIACIPVLGLIGIVLGAILFE
jgi:hypothetical protein